jgi:hypothetical protein
MSTEQYENEDKSREEVRTKKMRSSPDISVDSSLRPWDTIQAQFCASSLLHILVKEPTHKYIRNTSARAHDSKEKGKKLT